MSAAARVTRASVWGRAGITGLLVGTVVAAVVGAGGAVIPADPAMAADDTLTSSAVTLTNKANALNAEDAPFPDLEVTVSQTSDLVSQGIRVSWKNSKKSESPDTNHGGENFLQIAQCWGEDPDNPGHPDRRTCQYGGGRAAGSERDGFAGLDTTAPEDAKYTADLGFYAYTGIPFVATNSAGIVDEKQAPADRVLDNFTTTPGGQIQRKPEAQMVDLSNNQFFTRFTTNEVRWAPAGSDGSGSVPFEVQTAMQSTALGCGTPIVQPDNTAVGQSCWLVVIPRGTGDSGEVSNSKSGLWWDAWEHHLAVKLEFKPLGVRCEIGAAERHLAGSELVAGAVASWQPELCIGENGSPFVLSTGNEADAATKAAGTKPSPLAFVSRPLDLSRVSDTKDPLVYAPVALSGVVFSFAIDRQPHPVDATQEQKSRAGLPLTEMKLTPRLVAKLLTASYVDSLPGGADKSHIGYKSFREPGKNPRTIIQDPEFRKYNDAEWAAQIIVSASVADMLVPSGRSDLAVRVWEYVLADPEARAWLDGKADEWGMVVNPWYSTNTEVLATVNPEGVPLVLPTDSFPKADPIEKPDTTVSDPANGTGTVNLVTWRPFTPSFTDGAYNVLRADGLILGGWNKFSIPPKYDKSARELFGSQKVIGATTAPAAALYQTVAASLRNPAGEFVQPTEAGMLAATAAMSPTAAHPNVLQFDPVGANAKAAPTAYPLTMPVYAAINPLQTDAELRGVYANLIRYAASEGQTPGTDIGELPPGYAPLPKGWVNQAINAAQMIEQGIDPYAIVQPPADTPASQTSQTSQASQASSGTPSRTSGGSVPSPVSAAEPMPTSPNASGQAAGALAGVTTPDDPEIGAAAAAVPAGLASGLAAALAVPLLSRIRRRT
ncbi:hypothetical protein [Salinibacterium sp. ZJ450]|uniref:hypothetical protein n=1 Tax=Salinibacterium sp. ZJ450 TaxID=2708338 RepID=UPI0014200AFA|nr:hypothetical protein [Salinibacterium sp. ZJ450]